MIRHRILPAILAVILSLSLLGCGGSDLPPDRPSDLPPDFPGEMTSQTAPAEKSSAAVAELPELEQPSAPKRGENVPAADTVITLAADGSKVEGEGATVDGNTVTVNAPGSYLVTGSLPDGKLAVDVSEKEKVTLILDGVSIGNSAGSAIEILSAPEKVVLHLPEGSVNLLSCSAPDENTKAALFSKEDLTITGSGVLSVTAEGCKGIYGKDDLTVEGGKLLISATDDGLRGKDSLTILDGTVEIACGGDGIRSDDDEDISLGAIRISGGSIAVTAGQDGIQAGASLTVTDGSITLVCGGGSAEISGGNRPGDPGGDRPGGPGGRGDRGDRGGFDPGGRGGFDPFGGQNDAAADTDTVSKKGMKAEGTLTLSGGTINIDAADDALHSNGDLVLTGGTLTLSSSDDGIHADAKLEISGGDLTISRSYEGIEGRYITVSGGNIAITASDDGFNATAGSSAIEGGRGGPGGRGGVSTDCSLTITGGSVTLNAGGDGLDSNGSIYQTGGDVIVFGPSDGGNGAIDYGDGRDCIYEISGGSVLALGSVGMAQAPANKGQAVIAGQIGNISANTEITVTDGAGNVLITVTTPKTCAHLVFSSPALTSGESYIVTAGGRSTTLKAK